MNTRNVLQGSMDGSPITNGANSRHVKQNTWQSKDVKLVFMSENKISLSLSTEGFTYTTLTSTQMKEDYFQL